MAGVSDQDRGPVSLNDALGATFRPWRLFALTRRAWVSGIDYGFVRVSPLVVRLWLGGVVLVTVLTIVLTVVIILVAASGGSFTVAETCAEAAGSGDWTPARSFGRGVVPRGDSLEVALQGRGGARVRATVTAPDGSELTTDKFREGNTGEIEYFVARYPRDFTPPGMAGNLGLYSPGTYTVLWEADGALVACDRFEVSAVGVADAQACAPSGWSGVAPAGVLALGYPGGAKMALSGADQLIGVVGDPWYVFADTDRQMVTFADGSESTMYVSVSSSPKRVATGFTAGQVSYEFDASGEGVADLVDRSREFVVCAQQRLSAASTGASSASPADLPRSAFPSGEEGRVAWARACLPDASISLVFLPDLA